MFGFGTHSVSGFFVEQKKNALTAAHNIQLLRSDNTILPVSPRRRGSFSGRWAQQAQGKVHDAGGDPARAGGGDVHDQQDHKQKAREDHDRGSHAQGEMCATRRGYRRLVSF